MSAETIYVRGEAKTLKDSVEAWRVDHLEASNARFLEETLIPKLLGLVSFVEDRIRTSWVDYQVSPRTYPAQAKGEELAAFLDEVEAAVEGFEGCIAWCEERGYVIEGGTEARKAAVELAALHERFLDGWPMLDIAAAEAAQARVDAGHFINLEDLARVLDRPV